MKQSLIDLRKQIDKLNGEIFNLITERTRIAIEIAKYKKECNLKLVDKEREGEIITEIGRLAKNKGVSSKLTKEVFKDIIKLTKKEMRNKNYYNVKEEKRKS